MKYSFKFSFLGPKVRMFENSGMGIVIEKEPHVVCIYGTSEDNEHIFCAIPLCHPRFLKGLEYVVEFSAGQIAKITVGDIMVLIDFQNKKCANNKDARCYGSEFWGEDVSLAWSEKQQTLFP